jgi:regulator of PEP synthase PpsR (kinase-PPPase family)
MDQIDKDMEWRPTMNGQINSQIIHAQTYVSFLQERTLKRMLKRQSKIEIVENLPTPDPIRAAVRQRQERLDSLGNTEALVQQARARVLLEAQSEFRLVMEQLNAPHLNNQDRSAEESGDRILQGAKADQPHVDLDSPEEVYRKFLDLDEQYSKKVGER